MAWVSICKARDHALASEKQHGKLNCTCMRKMLSENSGVATQRSRHTLTAVIRTKVHSSSLILCLWWTLQNTRMTVDPRVILCRSIKMSWTVPEIVGNKSVSSMISLILAYHQTARAHRPEIVLTRSCPHTLRPEVLRPKLGLMDQSSLLVLNQIDADDDYWYSAATYQLWRGLNEQPHRWVSTF